MNKNITNTFNQTCYGISIANYPSIDFQVLKNVLHTLLYSYHQVEWCLTLLHSLTDSKMATDFIESFQNQEPANFYEEVNFTNYDHIHKTTNKERLNRISEWNTNFGILHHDELKNYCKTFQLNLDAAKRINNKKTFTFSNSPQKLYETLSKDIIGQEEAKKTLAVELFNHYMRKQASYAITDNDITFPKSNVLLVGPSGSGKSLLARKCAKILDVPFIRIDAASSVKSGIVGNSIMDNFQSHYNSVENIQELEYAIVFIDEFDKLATHYAYDRSAIQNEILNIIGEEGEATFEPERYAPKVKLDCSKMLFILCGAFQDLTSSQTKGLHIGYNTDQSVINETRVTRESLKKFGFSVEILNRIQKIIHLKPLTETELFSILKDSGSSPIIPYKNIFSELGKAIQFTDCFYGELAHQIITTKLNGRGPATILANIMEDLIFEISDLEHEIIIDKSYVNL